MLNFLRIRWNQFLEEVQEKSLREALRKAVSKCILADEIIVPVYCNLETFKQTSKSDPGITLDLMIVDKSNAVQAASMHASRSRRLKVYRNTEKGYYAYAAVSNGEIIGDVWCAAPEKCQCSPLHPDLPWLGISCDKQDAYMFDLFVRPNLRGKVITSYLLGSALNNLKESGYKRSYGFYEKNNVPALWLHRMFGYAELGKRRSFRFLFYKKTEQVA